MNAKSPSAVQADLDKSSPAGAKKAASDDLGAKFRNKKGD